MNEYRLPELPIIVHIRKNETGEVRIYHSFVYFDDMDLPSVFSWQYGNYSCDCNRRLFFARANNEEEDWKSKCGNGEYSVNIFLDNECIYSEFETND
jgi:hypothetical protein